LYVRSRLRHRLSSAFSPQSRPTGHDSIRSGRHIDSSRSCFRSSEAKALAQLRRWCLDLHEAICSFCSELLAPNIADFLWQNDDGKSMGD
jgi:hypothetical protein